MQATAVKVSFAASNQDQLLARHFVMLAEMMEASGDRKLATHFLEVAFEIYDELESRELSQVAPKARDSAVRAPRCKKGSISHSA